MRKRQAGMVLPEGVDPDNLPDEKALKRMLKEQKKNAPKDKSLSKVLKYVWDGYKVRFIIVIVCLVATAIISALSSVVLQNLISSFIEPALDGTGDLSGLPLYIVFCAALFMCAVIGAAVYNILMAQIGDRKSVV